MLVEDGVELVQVAAAHRVELAAVDVQRLQVALQAARVGVADWRQAAGDAAHRGLDRRVVAGAPERAVEHGVEPEDARAVAEVSIEQVDRALQLEEVVSRRGTNRLERDSALEHAARAENVHGGALLECDGARDGHGGNEVARDDDAAAFATAHRDQPGELEHAKCLSQGGLGDAEGGRELRLARQAIAAAQPRALDRLCQVLDRGFERSRRLDRRQGERGLGGCCHVTAVSQGRLDRKRVTLFHFKVLSSDLAAVEQGLRRVIGDGDTVPDREVEGLEPEDLLALHRSLVLLRTYDERSVVYHRQGRIGTYAIFWGHEAIQAGAVHALDRQDWIFPSYRESAVGILRGMPPSTVLSWWRGHPAGWWNPADWNVASICVPIATQVPHAAGLAWGLKLRGEDGVALVFFGDGATSEGAFHEGANIAAVTKAPLVLLCNNNQWAISTPLAAQTAAAALADKAIGYGMPAIRVDGTDVLAVYSAVREAVARARAGGGPTFVEAVTYRAAPHATADDPGAYIDTELVEAARAAECIGRFDGYLRRRGLLGDEHAERVRAEALDAMREGIAAAEAEPPGEVSLVFEHAYAEPPAALARDEAELRQVHAL